VLERELAVQPTDGEETSARVAGCVGRARQPLGQGCLRACVDVPQQLVDRGEVQLEALRRDVCLAGAGAEVSGWVRPSAAISLVAASISSPRKRPLWPLGLGRRVRVGREQIGWHLI
jgi:hypothetical protein